MCLCIGPCAYVHVCVCMRMCTCTCVCMYVYVRAHAYESAHVCAYVCVGTVCVHRYNYQDYFLIHKYISVCACAFVCVCACAYRYEDLKGQAFPDTHSYIRLKTRLTERIRVMRELDLARCDCLRKYIYMYCVSAAQCNVLYLSMFRVLRSCAKSTSRVPILCVSTYIYRCVLRIHVYQVQCII